MKKGFTIVELVISMAIFAIILVTTSTIFVTALKNYQIGATKSALGKDLNFTIDDISKNIKQATIAENYNSYSLSSTTLVLALPTTDQNGNFLYDGATRLKDYVIYFQVDNTLHKITYSTPSSVRAAENGIEKTLLSDIKNLNFEYLPGTTNPATISVSIETGRTIQNTEVTAREKVLANLRNRQ